MVDVSTKTESGLVSQPSEITILGVGGTASQLTVASAGTPAIIGACVSITVIVLEYVDLLPH